MGWLLLVALAALSPGSANAQGTTEGTPAVCRIGVNIEDLYDLDMAADTFGAILWIWSLCPTPDLRPLERMAFPTADSGPDLGDVETIDTGTSQFYASRRVQGTFRHDWDMDHYPFDRQRVTIEIDDEFHGAARLLFEPDTEQSFLTPGLHDLDEWRVSDLILSAGVSDESSTYGLPGAQGSRYAFIEASVVLERAQVVPFLKLTSGVFAGVFIAFLTFFYDPSDRGAFGGKLGLLVGVLFAVLLNMRNADTTIGDIGDLTLVTELHLVTLALIVVLALAALRDRRRVERDLPVRHPNWPLLTIIGSLYVLVAAALILYAARS
ncbi:hypothetical protein [Paracoccus benzoatiresistens]|uniref:Neurotransmitter-gated ion-channel ligand-binding domain-containing protein n=1 Tax=Paracoccus benzoatiresistens TaxID=2997341 RepID=A0ABT4JA18_9RHOB|nr:hypothetical protein [Paracoccus sp. EF6]MCZ0963759.1 hypothetical protein [Paracoccus sp. EF6]